MKLKHLESLLQDIEPFRDPNGHLEQYPTGAHLAACVLHAAAERDDVDGRVVVDLGVGGGVLGIAASMMGAKRVVGVDVDPAAIELARENCDAFDPPIEIELRLGKVPRDVDAWSARGRREEEEEEEEEDLETATPSSSDASDPNRALRADTVVMNPPFGTRRKGADMGFLRAALGVTRRGGAVYSLHKSSTRAHVERHALVVLRAKSAEVLAELRYELPRVYSHHRRDAVDIEVDLWRFEPPEDGVVGGGAWRDSEDEEDDASSDDDDDDGGDDDDDDIDPAGRTPAGRKDAPIELRYQDKVSFGARESDVMARTRREDGRRRSGGKGARDADKFNTGRGRGGRGRGGRGR